MTATPLLDWQPSYPEVPGHCGVDTSIAAAEAVKDETGSLRSAPISHGNGGFDQ